MHLRCSSLRRSSFVALAALGLLLVACSPEATRTRSGGPGADVGNRGRSVELHGPNRADTAEPEGMFYHTPSAGQAIRK